MPILKVVAIASPASRQRGTFHVDDLGVWKAGANDPSEPIVFGHFVDQDCLRLCCLIFDGIQVEGPNLFQFVGVQRA
jgi:hypothetical protein